MPIVGKTREGRFLLLFVTQFLLFAGFLAYYEIVSNTTDALTTFIEILYGLAPIVIVATANTIVVIEGAEMLSEKYLKKRYEAGQAEERKRWLEWNERRLEAQAANEPFDEPPPSDAK